MAEKGKSTGLQRLKQDLAAKQIGPLYLFYGEEGYLRDSYLNLLRSALIDPGMEEFNLHRLSGREVTAQGISDAAETMPMMAERTVVVVNDYDLFAQNEQERGVLTALLQDLPEYCCLIFVFDVVEYRPDKKQKELWAVLEQNAVTVKFEAQEQSDLFHWIHRHFKALGKEIDTPCMEHLVFLCGGLMTGLLPEIQKIAAYSKGEKVTREEIDAVADPVPDAVAFELTNEITRGNYDKAAEKLGQMYRQQEEPIMLLAMIGRELRKIYSARLALESGKTQEWLMQMWGMKSAYPAKLLMEAARKVSRRWCQTGVKLCRAADLQMKRSGEDKEEILTLLLMRLAQEAKQ